MRGPPLIFVFLILFLDDSAATVESKVPRGSKLGNPVNYSRLTYLKFSFNFVMKRITMLELRQQVGAVIRGLRQGQNYVLSYRDARSAKSRPLQGRTDRLRTT